METMATRCMRIGLVKPDEQSFRNILAAMVACGFQVADSEKLTWLNELKRLLRGKAKRSPVPDPYVTTFPGSHEELPQPFKATYAEEEILEMEPSKAADMVARLPLRRTSRIVRGQSQLALPSQQQPVAPTPNMMQAGMSGLQAMMANDHMKNLMAQNPMMAMMACMMSMAQPQSQQPPPPPQRVEPVITFMRAPEPAAAPRNRPQESDHRQPLFDTGLPDTEESMPDSALSEVDAQSMVVQEALKRRETEKANAKKDAKKAVAKKAAAKKAGAMKKPAAAPEKVKEEKKVKKEPAEKNDKTAKTPMKAKLDKNVKEEKPVVKEEEKMAAKSGSGTCSGIKGKSIYGLARDQFKKDWMAKHDHLSKEEKKAWEAQWQSSDECQEVLRKMSETERKKRRLDHLFAEIN